MKVTITTTSFGKYDNSVLKLCEDKGLSIVLNPYSRKILPDELVELAKDTIGLIAGTETISEEVLLRLPRLKVISRCGAGMGNIDIKAAKKLNIALFNTPDAPTGAVAELTVCLIMSLIRKVFQMDREIRKGQWNKKMGSLLNGKDIGIIGFGRIGSRVAELLKPFGCNIAFYDPFVEASGVTKLSMEDLLRWADVVSIHVSGQDKIIGEKELHMMKKGAWLVNVSRGGVIDEEALYISLKTQYLAGAALDVFEHEPYIGPLKDLDNVILTPHIGSYAREARAEMERQAVENLIKGFERAGLL